jgi:hypothetical protein
MALADDPSRRGLVLLLTLSLVVGSVSSVGPVPTPAANCSNQENWNVVDPSNAMATVLQHNASEKTLGGCCAACAALPGCVVAGLASPAWGAYAGCFLKKSGGTGTSAYGVTTIFMHFMPAPAPTPAPTPVPTPAPTPALNCSIKENWNVVDPSNPFATVLQHNTSEKTLGGCCAACAALPGCVVAGLASPAWAPYDGCFLKKIGGNGSIASGVTTIFMPAPTPAPNCSIKENWNVVDPSNPMATVLQHNTSEKTLGGCCAACAALPGCVVAGLAPPAWGAYAGCFLKKSGGNGSSAAGLIAIFNNAPTASHQVAPAQPSSNTMCNIQQEWDVNIPNDIWGSVLEFLPLVTTEAGCCSACRNLSTCILGALAPPYWKSLAGCYLKSGEGVAAKRAGITAMFVKGRAALPYTAPPLEWRQTLEFTIVLVLVGWAMSLLVGIAVVRILHAHNMGGDMEGGLGHRRRGSIKGLEMGVVGGADAADAVEGGHTEEGSSRGSDEEQPSSEPPQVAKERRRSNVEATADVVTSMMVVYTQRRATEKLRKQNAVANFGLCFSFVSVVLYMAESCLDEFMTANIGSSLATSAVEREVTKDAKNFYAWQTVAEPVTDMLGGIFVLSSGLAPEQLLSRRVANVYFFANCVISGLAATFSNTLCYDLFWSDEPLAKVTLAWVPGQVICFFYLVMQRRLHGLAAAPSPWGLKVTEIFTAYLVISNVNNGFFFLRLATTGRGPVSYNHIGSASIQFICAFGQLIFLRKVGRKIQGIWFIWIWNNILINLAHGYDYFYPCHGTTFQSDIFYDYAIMHIAVAAAWLTIWKGRRFYFRVVSGIFERKQRITDGAVVASLLELRSQPAVGDVWFLLDRDFQHWYPGHVTEVQESRVVEGRVVTESRFLVTLDMGAPGEEVVEQLAWRDMPPARSQRDLTEHAVRSTRFMPFSAMTLELLQSSKGDDSTFALSEPLKPGGRIDWFISHSWHDDCSQKFAELTRLASEFKRKHRRFPTVWLDKTCIDQSSISDSLKCLPIFLQACDAVVALVGETYFSRLWCVWELYARIAFSDGSRKEGKSKARVRFYPLREIGDQEDLRHVVSSFDLSASRCFDPNEQSKLVNAIAAADGGSAAFEAAVRSFGSLIKSDGTESSPSPATRRRSLDSQSPNSSRRSVDSSSSSSSSSSRDSLDSRSSMDSGSASSVRNPLAQDCDVDQLEEGINPGVDIC